MSRKLVVEIIGDASSLQRSFKTAGAESASFSSKLGLTKAGLIGVAAAAGGFAVEIGVKSVEAAMKGEAAQAALDQALRNTHQSVAAMTPVLEKAEAASRKLGFADDDSRAALARLEIATGNTKTAISDLAVAEDLARVKHVDLQAATGTLAQAMTGSQRAAKLLGISISPVTENYDKLKAKYKELGEQIPRTEAAQAKLLDKMQTGKAVVQAVTDKVHGQAQAYSETAAGSMARFHAETEHLQEALGKVLLPAIVKVVDGLSHLVEWFDKNKNAMIVLQDAIKVATTVIKAQLTIWETEFKALRSVVETVIGAILGAIDKFLGGLQKVFDVASHIPFVGDKFKGVASAIGDARAQLHGLQADIDALHGKTVDVVTRNITVSDNFHHRAMGGRVTAGVPYIVGEQRPEVFVPDQSGTILPRVPASTGGGGGTVVQVTVNGWVGNDQDIARRVRTELTKINRQGTTLGFA